MIQRRDKKRTASAKRIQAAFLEDNHIDIEEIPPKEEYVRDTVNKQLRACAYRRDSEHLLCQCKGQCVPLPTSSRCGTGNHGKNLFSGQGTQSKISESALPSAWER